MSAEVCTCSDSGVTSVGKMAKIFVVFFTFGYFCLGSFSSASSGKEEIGLEFKGQIMSAELQGVSLRMVLEKLKRERGIWFTGDESALEENISVQFDDLPLDEGLRRILSNINHALVFDRGRGLVGLFILGKKDPGRGAPRDAGVITGKSPASQPVEEATVSKDPFGVFPDASPPGNPKTKSTDTTTGVNLRFSRDPRTEITDKSAVKRSPSTGNPFTQKISPSPENPFGENAHPTSRNPFDDNITSPFENPFSGSVLSSPGNPFEVNIPPSSEDPFANPLEEFFSPEGQKLRRE